MKNEYNKAATNQDVETVMLMDVASVTAEEASQVLDENNKGVEDRAVARDNNKTDMEVQCKTECCSNKSFFIRNHEHNDDDGTEKSELHHDEASELNEECKNDCANETLSVNEYDDIENANENQTAITAARGVRPPQPVAPGAVAVDGLEAASYDDDYTVTAPPEVPPQVNPMEPITARIVHGNEEDYEVLREELQWQGEQLRQVIAERENAAVAQVVADEAEAQHGNIDEEPFPRHDYSSNQEILSIIKQSVSCLCGPRMKWIAAISIVLVIVGIVLGIVLQPMMQDIPPQHLIDFLSMASLDGGTALQNPSTTQNDALKWLAGNANLDTYSDTKKIQRYVLATLYYSTNGDSWNDNTGWLRDSDECRWHTDAAAFGEHMCSSGAVVNLDFYDGNKGNNLDGTIPKELALLSGSLGVWLK